ncbi:MAG: terminase family protein [Candidatus Thermoplasmatota archaeon]|nr:terminase family protein [Candidatus Thermoplasmatota archaeon]
MITTKINAKPHAGQLEVHNSDARFKVLSAGRRWGKTRLGVNECLDAAAQGGRAWWVSPSYKTSEVGWRPLRQIARKIPGAEIRLVDRVVNFPGGGFVAIRSADNPDSLRGEGLDFVVMDECAFMQKEAWTEAIRPALSDRQGNVLFISTPKGRNWLWEIYQRGVSGEEGWQSWTFPTANNPFIAKEEIEAAKRDLPEMIFRQEYLAEFIDDAGGVFRRVQDAAVLEPKEYEEGKQYIAGVDVAASVDFTVVSVLDAESKEMVYIDRFNRVDYPVLIDRLEAIYHRYHMTSMVVESNSIGRPVIDELVARGLNIVPFTTTSATKQSIIQNLQAAFENGQIRILNNPVLIGELLSFESKRNASGGFSYSAPDGMNDDCVMSLAIAWYGANSGGTILWLEE